MSHVPASLYNPTRLSNQPQTMVPFHEVTAHQSYVDSQDLVAQAAHFALLGHDESDLEFYQPGLDCTLDAFPGSSSFDVNVQSSTNLPTVPNPSKKEEDPKGKRGRKRKSSEGTQKELARKEALKRREAKELTKSEAKASTIFTRPHNYISHSLMPPNYNMNVQHHTNALSSGPYGAPLSLYSGYSQVRRTQSFDETLSPHRVEGGGIVSCPPGFHEIPMHYTVQQPPQSLQPTFQPSYGFYRDRSATIPLARPTPTGYMVSPPINYGPTPPVDNMISPPMPPHGLNIQPETPPQQYYFDSHVFSDCCSNVLPMDNAITAMPSANTVFNQVAPYFVPAMLPVAMPFADPTVHSPVSFSVNPDGDSTTNPPINFTTSPAIYFNTNELNRQETITNTFDAGDFVPVSQWS